MSRPSFHWFVLLLGFLGLATAGSAATTSPAAAYSYAAPSASPNATSTSTSPTYTQSLPAAASSEIFPYGRLHPNPIQPWQVPWGRRLPQSATNGKSPYGVIPNPRYPPFVGAPGWGQSGGFGSSQGGQPYTGGWPGQGRPSTFPWGGRTAGNTNPYQNPPQTGVVRSYNFVIERGVLAPDGVQRNVLLVNGQYPGPTVEANWGDTIQVTVTNNIQNPEEGTAIHWHGLLQTNTPYEDGVPGKQSRSNIRKRLTRMAGITQSPIAPGQTFTYSFCADLYGTSWYHAHFSAQYAGGKSFLFD